MSDSPVDIDDYEFVAQPGTTSNLASLFGSAMTIPEDVSLNYRAPVQPARPKSHHQSFESQTKADLLFTAVAEAWSLSNDRWTDHGKIGVAISSFQDAKTIILYRSQTDVITRTVLKSLVVETKGKGHYTFVNGEDNTKYVIMCKNRGLREAIQHAGGKIMQKKRDKEKVEIAKKSTTEEQRIEPVQQCGVEDAEAVVEVVKVEDVEVEIVEAEIVETEIVETEIVEDKDVKDKTTTTTDDKAEVGTEVQTRVKSEAFEDSSSSSELKLSIDALHVKVDKLLEDKTIDSCRNCEMCKFTRRYERQLDESDGEMDFYSFVSRRIEREVADDARLAQEKYEMKLDGRGSKLLDRIWKECLAKCRRQQERTEN